VNDETHYRLLKLIESNPEMSQRDLADAMGVSLGKLNYCLRAVMERGLVKVKNFKANPNKRIYAYYLTPKGAEEKTKITARFLKRKMAEYEQLKEEIKRLKRETVIVKVAPEADMEN
jgi:EPS-associated MarR family transcriptional regulator